MRELNLLHERTFANKPLKSLKVYDDPFGENELCIELTFIDGQVACLTVVAGRPKLLRSDICYEPAHFKKVESAPQAARDGRD